MTPLPPLASFGDGTYEADAERCWKRIPFLGWIIRSILWTQRTERTTRRIKHQLLNRPKPDASLWGDNAFRCETARFICLTAHQEMKWPNDHFIPDDPANVLLLAFDDFQEAPLLVGEVEEHFGIELNASEVKAWSSGTLGELVDFITEVRRQRERSDARVWPPLRRR